MDKKHEELDKGFDSLTGHLESGFKEFADSVEKSHNKSSLHCLIGSVLFIIGMTIAFFTEGTSIGIIICIVGMAITAYSAGELDVSSKWLKSGISLSDSLKKGFVALVTKMEELNDEVKEEHEKNVKVKKTGKTTKVAVKRGGTKA